MLWRCHIIMRSGSPSWVNLQAEQDLCELLVTAVVLQMQASRRSAVLSVHSIKYLTTPPPRLGGNSGLQCLLSLAGLYAHLLWLFIGCSEVVLPAELPSQRRHICTSTHLHQPADILPCQL